MHMNSTSQCKARINRRAFLAAVGALSAAALASRRRPVAAVPDSRLNILLITLDDLNYTSLGFMGSKVPDITPNLDKLSRESYRFSRGHVTVAICQPSRQCMMTGRYPHNMGAPAFDPIREDVPTLQERLRAAGYLNGIFGKETHLAPKEKFCWDTYVPASELGIGRDPQRYYEETQKFLARAKSEGRPFFLMANSQDPHRPFAGSQDEINRWQKHLPVNRTYKPEEIEVPGFLPDIPGVREDLACYYTSVHRGDESLGLVLRALDEAGMAEKTLVMYLSDNGMAFPFAKANCYLTSTRTPWLVRWPGVTEAGKVEPDHFVSGVDYAPSILEAVDLEPLPDLDGRSFMSLLRGESQPGRDQLYTLYNRPENGNLSIRCMQDRRYGYIWNPWGGSGLKFGANYMMGPAWEGMQDEAKSNPEMAARMKLFLNRVPQELYDFESDPSALSNLIDDPAHRDTLHDLRQRLLAEMTRSNDPLREDFAKLVEHTLL
ncbi:MAG: sulfatase [Candidatus Hydrogenedentes bacterium]|nr:sulfatase [Candidatus Hydrogenedentota bacterium]